MSKQIEQESMKAPAEENGRLLTDKDIRKCCLLYTYPSPRDWRSSRMPSSA